MEWLEAAIAVVLGLVCGSFITLASFRLPRGEDIIKTPSRCPHCQHRLGVRDLFPVLSWVISCAQCRHCNRTIHWRYPLIELITALVFYSIYAHFGVSLEALLLALFSALLLIMIVADFEHYIIPDEIHFALLPLGLFYRVLTQAPWQEIAGGLLLGAGIGLGLRFGYQWIKKREGLGWGDVKFLAVVGLWLGVVPMVPFLFFAGLLGVATALIWRVMGRGALFPFGPALALSLYICVVYPEVPEAFWNIQRLVYL